MYIKIEDTRLETSKGLTFDDALRLIGTATLAIMQGLDQDVKEHVDEEEYKKVHGHIYDTYNIMAGNILDAFDNTRSPGTDLTAEAILRAENEILDEAVPDSECTGLEIETTEETNSPA